MFSRINTYLKINSLNLGKNLFLFGIFFLPSALPIGIILLLVSLCISFREKKNINVFNKWDLSFLICITIMLISSLNVCFINTPDELKEYNKSIILLNLFNWIPPIIIYFGVQNYLLNFRDRILFEKFLIAGTFPVIISCVMQKFFNIYGPFETFFGTIVWFNKPIIVGVSGLFSNANYLGMWLTLCLPFSLVRFNLENNNFKNKIFLYSFNLLLIYFTIETNSRNALFGIFLSLLLVYNFKKIISFCFFLFLGYLFFEYFIKGITNINFSNLFDNNVFSKFQGFDKDVKIPRLAIWKGTLSLIFERPFFGWGATTFAHLYKQNEYLFNPFINMNYQHSHNLILELAYTFGIPLSLLYTYTVSSIFIPAIKKIYYLKNFFDSYNYKPWIASFIIFLFAHLSDVTYYDGKISILAAILFAGVRNINNQMNELHNKENKNLIN